MTQRVADRSGNDHPEHRVELSLTHIAGTGARYRVTHLGAVLIESTRDPEFEACRALLAKGITGTMVTYSPGSPVPRMRLDIEKGAALMTIESATVGLRICRYKPHPRAADDPEDGDGVSRPAVSAYTGVE